MPTPTPSEASPPTLPAYGMPFLKQICYPHTATMQHYLNVANNDGSFNENVPDSAGASPESATSASATQDVADIIALLPSDHMSILDDAIGNFASAEDLNLLSLSSMSPIPALTDAGYDTMTLKATTLVSGLRELHRRLELSDPTWKGPHDIDQIEVVFCAERLRFYTAAFFRLTHVHFPLVHYPTFGTSQTSQYLILAVAIFGASRSAPFRHTMQVKQFAPLAEEFIFRGLEELIRAPPRRLSLEQLQTLQAAVAVTNLMINHNDWSLRERARLKRLPTLIYTVRRFKLTAALSEPTLDWQQFIYNETGIR